MRTIFILLIGIIFSSCSVTHYYYSTLDSEELIKVDRGIFESNADSMLIAYSFSGENAPVKIQIKNKMSSSIHVDWANSWYMINNDGNKVYYSDFLDPIEHVSVILNHRQKSKSFPGVCNLNFSRIGKTDYETGYYKTIEGGERKMNTHDFSEASSPMHFTSNLFFYVDDIQSSPIELKHEFYVSNIVKGKVNPENLDSMTYGRGDVFYASVSKSKQEKSLDKGEALGSILGSILVYTLEHMWDSE